jgi:hypothetical protein
LAPTPCGESWILVAAKQPIPTTRHPTPRNQRELMDPPSPSPRAPCPTCRDPRAVTRLPRPACRDPRAVTHVRGPRARPGVGAPNAAVRSSRGPPSSHSRAPGRNSRRQPGTPARAGHSRASRAPLPASARHCRRWASGLVRASPGRRAGAHPRHSQPHPSRTRPAK